MRGEGRGGGALDGVWQDQQLAGRLVTSTVLVASCSESEQPQSGSRSMMLPPNFDSPMVEDKSCSVSSRARLEALSSTAKICTYCTVYRHVL